MDLMDKNEKEIKKKQRKLGKLDKEQSEVYRIVKERIAAMSNKKKIKLLMKKSRVDKLIAEVRKELNG